jgi:hypothetical protein
MTFYASEGQNTEALVAKISADGSRLIYAGYIGGERFDYATGVAVDAQGFAYVCGTTYSNPDTEHFPLVVGPGRFLNGEHQESRNQDPFIAKISPDGTALVYSGYVTAIFAEDATDVAVDAQGNAYVAGVYTYGGYTEIAPRPRFEPCQSNQLESNGFVVKVKADGTGAVWQNWIIGNGVDDIFGIAVDSAGSAYVTGFTTSPSICYVKKGPRLTPGGAADAFVGKMLPDGSGFEYLGYIGGTGEDIGTRIAVDASGAAYVVGMTKSTESSFPVTTGPDLTHNGPAGGFDAFVAKVKPDGSDFEYCGYLGGSADESTVGVAVDSRGRAFVAGFTASADFPTANAVDSSFAGGGTLGDAFVAEVAANGRSLEFSTYLGGTGRDAAMAIALDRQGAAVVAGITESQDGSFPTTANAFNAMPKGNADAFVVKLVVGPAGPPPPSITAVAKSGKFLVVTGANFVAGAKVLVNGTAYKAKPDAANPTTVLKSKKAGKVVQPGDTVTVRNPDGSVSNPVTFSG